MDKLKNHEKELRKELFGKDDDNQRGDAGGGGASVNESLDLRGKGVGEQGAPPTRLYGNDDDTDVAV